MATLENLNFKIILDDSDFNKKIAEAEKRAKELNLSLSNYLSLRDRANRIARESTAAQKQLNAATRQHTSDLTKQASILKQLNGLAATYFSVQGARSFMRELVSITGEFEAQRVALESMLGSKDKAEEIFKALRRNALESPYTLQDLTKYAKQLTAFNVDADSLVETEKRLADVAAGLGVDMGRIVLAYGQVKSAGVLKGTELRQFTEAGVPILQQVADLIEEAEGRAVSLSEVFNRISKKQIPFEMVEEAFKRMTSEGGKFYNMQAELVETVKGKVGKLRDVWQQTLYDLGSEGTINEILKGGLDTITRIVAGFENMGRVIVEAIALFGSYKTALLVAEACAARLTVQETLASVAAGTLNKVTKALNKTLLLNPYAAIAAGVTALAFAIYKAATAESAFDTQLKNANKAIADFEAKVSDEVSSLDYLFRNLERAKRGTREYQNAKKQILNNYEQYLNATDKEALRVGNLAEVYDHLKDSIIEANRARALEDGSQAISKAYSDTFNAISKAFRQNFKERPTERGIMQELADYLFGRNGVTADNLSQAARDYKEQIDATITAVMNTPGGMFGNGLSTTLTSIDALKNRLEEAEEAANGARDALADGLDLIFGPSKARPKESKAAQTGGGGKDDTKAERAIKERIALLQKYKDAFDSLRQNPLIGEDNARELMSLFYGIGNTDFVGQINDLSKELLKLNPELQDYVAELRAGFGKDAADEYLNSLKALDSVSKKMEEYLSKDFQIEGEGIAAKISKLLIDLGNADKEIEGGFRSFIEGLSKEEIAVKVNYILANKEHFEEIGFSPKGQEVAAENYWNAYRKKALEAWREQMAREKQASKKMTAEKVVGYADNLFKSLTGGLDLTNFNDKTITQLQTIRAALSELSLPADISEVIKDPELLERFTKAFDKARFDGIKKLDLALSEKRVSAAKKMLGAFQGMGAAIADLGDSINSDVLEGMGNILSVAEEITAAISENEAIMESLFSTSESAAEEIADAAGGIASSSDYITLFVKIAALMIKLSAQAAGDLDREIEAIWESYRDLLELTYQLRLNDGTEGPFGSNFVRKMENAKALIDELNKSMEKTIERGSEFGFLWYSSWEKIVQGGNGKSDAIANTLLTAKSGWFGKEQYTLAELARGRGELFDKNGNANIELLKIIRDAYKWDDISANWLDNLISYTEAYNEALAVVEDEMEVIFGNIARNAADSVVDSWLNAGEAALDYADILDDVAKSYAKMLIQSAILENVFDEAHIQEIAAKFMGNEYGEAMAMIGEDMERIAGLEPVFNSILQTFEPYFNKAEAEGGNLANGIKGITEDTANLLASYLNAIRSDVSILRTLNALGWNEVSAIRETLPTLADYAAKIEAHTANIAQNTHDAALIAKQTLEELRGMIVNEGSGRGIRSYPA